MPALEKRYDQDSSTASSDEEDFVNASPPSRSPPSAGVARTGSRASNVSSRSSRRGAAKVHSSSSSESTDSDEEAALQEELRNAADPEIETGVVRGQPVEGTAARIMRSIGKGDDTGRQRYQRVDSGTGRSSSRRDSTRSSRGGAGDGLERSTSNRSSRSSAQRELGSSGHHHHHRKSKSKKEGSRRAYALGKSDPSTLEAGGQPSGTNPAADRTQPKKSRTWLWVGLAVLVVLIIAIVIAVVLVLQNKKSDTSEAGSTAVSDSLNSTSSANATGSGQLSGSHAASLGVSVSGLLGASGITATPSASMSFNDGQYHPATATSGAATSRASGLASVDGNDEHGAASKSAAASATASGSLHELEDGDENKSTKDGLGDFGEFETASPGDSTGASQASSASQSMDGALGQQTASTSASQLGGASHAAGQLGASVVGTGLPSLSMPSSLGPEATDQQHDQQPPISYGAQASQSPGLQQPGQSISLPLGGAFSSNGGEVFVQTTMPSSMGGTPTITMGGLPPLATMSTGIQQPGQQQPVQQSQQSGQQQWPGQQQPGNNGQNGGQYGGGQQPQTYNNGAWDGNTQVGQTQQPAATPTDPHLASAGAGSPFGQDQVGGNGGQWGQATPPAQAGWGSTATTAPSWGGADSWGATAGSSLFGTSQVYQASAPETFQTNEGRGTWFDESQHYTSCGVPTLKDDYVVAISNATWIASSQGSLDGRSSYCGAEVIVTNMANGLSIKAWAVERCALCEGDGALDLSIPVFKALSNDDLDVGVLQIMWGFSGNSVDLSSGNSAAQPIGQQQQRQGAASAFARGAAATNNVAGAAATPAMGYPAAVPQDAGVSAPSSESSSSTEGGGLFGWKRATAVPVIA